MGAAFADIANLCAPTMALEQAAAIANVQSAVSRLAIRFNSGGFPKVPVDTEDQAVRIATVRIAAGEDLDLGLMGVNGSLLKVVGLTIRGAFDPCLNLKAAVSLLDLYQRDAAKAGVADAERKALERYFGKGGAQLGSRSGFAERVSREAKRLKGKTATLEIKDWVPALPAREFTGDRGEPGSAVASGSSSVEKKRVVEPPATAGPPPAWDVFARARAMPGGVYKTGEAK